MVEPLTQDFESDTVDLSFIDNALFKYVSLWVEESKKNFINKTHYDMTTAITIISATIPVSGCLAQ
jgi:hypothetical protein